MELRELDYRAPQLVGATIVHAIEEDRAST